MTCVRRSLRAAAPALLALLVLAGAAGCPEEKQQPAQIGTDANFLVQRGLSEYRAGRLESALRSLEQAKVKSPHDRQVQYVLGVVLIQRGEYKRAEAEIEDGLAAAPDDPELLNLRGVARLRDRRFDEAIADFQAALAPERKYATPEAALANLAEAYTGQGRADDAIATYWKALDMDPKDGVLRTALCQTLAGANRLDVALHECSTAATDAPKYPPAFLAKGDVLRALSKKEDAIAAYRKAFEIAPKGDDQESARRKLIELGAGDPGVTGKRKDRWELPARAPDEAPSERAPVAAPPAAVPPPAAPPNAVPLGSPLSPAPALSDQTR